MMFRNIVSDLPDPGWSAEIGGEFSKPYMERLGQFLHKERDAGQTVYPREDDIFNALRLTAFKDIRVVILGQDPYHGPGQAHGLSFSVPEGVTLPPSLRNIYKEIERDFGTRMPARGDLSAWAEQGVLLLNATLTVRGGQAGSHQKRGWEDFTDAVISRINARHDGVVYMLWGAYAQKKGAMIDRTRNLVLESVHPSPLSAHRGFIGNGHFSAANDYLEKSGRARIAWSEL